LDYRQCLDELIGKLAVCGIKRVCARCLNTSFEAGSSSKGERF